MTNLESLNDAPANALTDPVCRMKVDPGQTGQVAIYRAHTYWFCSLACRTAFEMNPRKYLDEKGGPLKGWIRRHLERILKVRGDKQVAQAPNAISGRN